MKEKKPQTDAPKTYLKMRNKIGYGSGDLAANMSYGLVSSFVLIYLTDTVGLNAGIVGTLMMLSKLLDGISDVFFGRLIDRTHSKMGKARPWMLYSQIGVSILLIMVFSTPAFAPVAQYVYFFITYTLLNAVFYTANNIAYSSLTSLTTKNAGERVQLGSIRFIFSLVTNILVAAMTVKLATGFSGEGAKMANAAGWRTVAIIYAVIALIVNTIAVFSVKELPDEELNEEANAGADTASKVSFIDSLKYLFANKYYLMIVGIYIFTYLSTGITSAVGTYYMTYIFKNPGLLGTFSLVTYFPMIIALVFTPALVKKAKGIYKVSNIGYDFALVFRGLFVIFAFMGNMPLMLATLFLNGLCTGPLTGSLNAYIAQASDYTQHTKGVRMEGMMYSCSSLGIKIGSGIGTALSGWLLAAGGYLKPAADAVEQVMEQPASAITMMKVSYALIPWLCIVCIKILVKLLKVEQANRELVQKNAEA